MKKIGFVHAYRAAKDLSLLNEGTQDGIEIGLLGLLVHCRILGDHHKVLQKLQVCHRLPQMHLCPQCCQEADGSIGFCVCICGT